MSAEDIDRFRDFAGVSRGTNGNGVQPVLPEVRPLSDLVRPNADDPNELLKNRFLCRGGSVLVLGPTGIGKSSFVMQGAVSWSLGKGAFGIQPNGKLRILIVQAENDDGDMAEMRDGILAGMGLTPEEAQAAGVSIMVIREDTLTGLEFCATLDRILEQTPCDLVIIDPAFAYLDGDASCQRDVSTFLRNGLNPVLRRHDCGAIVVHHTNKPPTGKEKVNWQAGDFAYAGSGSAEFANWARAVIVLRSTGSHDVFELRLGKRGKRVGWKQEDGVTPRFTTLISHAQGDEGIFWKELVEDDLLGVNLQPDRPSKLNIMELVPKTETISKSALISKGQGIGIGVNRAKGFIADLVHDGALHEWRIPRAGTRPEIHIARCAQPVEANPGL